MSGVNGNVIMSGYGDENPDDEGREAAKDNPIIQTVLRGEVTVMVVRVSDIVTGSKLA